MFTFFNSLKLLVLRSFDFKGRASRSEFAWAALAVGLAGCVILYPYYSLITAKTWPALKAICYGAWIGDLWGSGGLNLTFSKSIFPLAIFTAIALIPVLSLVVRRLHDLDVPAKFLWFFLLAPVFPGLGLGMLFVTGVQLSLKGNKGSNAYGPDPYGHKSVSRTALGLPALKTPGVFD